MTSSHRSPRSCGNCLLLFETLRTSGETNRRLAGLKARVTLQKKCSAMWPSFHIIYIYVQTHTHKNNNFLPFLHVGLEWNLFVPPRVEIEVNLTQHSGTTQRHAPQCMTRMFTALLPVRRECLAIQYASVFLFHSVLLQLAYQLTDRLLAYGCANSVAKGLTIQTMVGLIVAASFRDTKYLFFYFVILLKETWRIIWYVFMRKP